MYVHVSTCQPLLRANSLASANVLNMDGVYFSLFNYWPVVLQGEYDVVCHLVGPFCLRWQHRKCLKAQKIHSERLELSWSTQLSSFYIPGIIDSLWLCQYKDFIKNKQLQQYIKTMCYIV